MFKFPVDPERYPSGTYTYTLSVIPPLFSLFYHLGTSSKVKLQHPAQFFLYPTESSYMKSSGALLSSYRFWWTPTWYLLADIADNDELTTFLETILTHLRAADVTQACAE
ncbi:hypothetical protein D9758_011127 [Tetrapyrgos nigripes]|uniref:Uncharacterized protein n=1 Tax=Tetrapyrgos nigripes TaxID=182062 RepID=A0A8H5CLF4_9AGAR|nr:hypothetical protein D9758_011127 [Tetrapyrgos nigripes]